MREPEDNAARKNRQELLEEIAFLRNELRTLRSLGGAGEGSLPEEEAAPDPGYEWVMHASNDMITTVDGAFTYLAVSDSFCRGHARQREAILGLHVADIWGHDVFEEVLRAPFERCFQGESCRYEAWFELPVRGKRYFEVNFVPMYYSGGKCHAVVVSRDITERRRMEEDLIMHKQMVMSSSDRIALLSPSCDYLAANAKYTEAFHLSPGEIRGMNAVETLGQAFVDDVMRKHVARCLKGENTRFQTWHEFPALGRRYADVGYFPYYDLDGTIAGAVITTRDATEQQKAAEALRDSERRFRALAENSPSLILRFDCELRITYINPAIGKYSRWTPETSQGKRIPELIQDSGLTRKIEEKLELALGITETLQADFSYTSDLGNEYHFQAWLVPEIDPNGALNAVIAVVHDVTQFMNVQEALRESEARYRALFHALPVGITVADGQGRFVNHNEAAKDLLGLPSAEITGRSLFNESWNIVDENGDALDPEGLASVRALRTRTVHRQVVGVGRPDGSRVWLDVTAAPVTMESEGVIIAFSDITQQRLAEEALAESENHYRELMEAAPYGIFEVDISGDVILCNSAMVALVEQPPASLIGKEAFGLFPPGEQETMRQLYHAVLRDKPNPFPWTTRLHLPSGVKDVEVAWNYRRDRHGTVTGLAVLLTDITERKQEQARETALQQQLAQSQKLESLGILAGGVAHDFNNILMAVIGNTDLALDEAPADSVMRELLLDILAGAQRAADLASQMLAYSGKGFLCVVPLDLRDMVAEMGKLLHAVLPKDAELRYEFAPTLPAIQGDATQLRQVVMNLITNASEALENKGGKITMRVYACHFHGHELSCTYLVDTWKEGEYVVLEVEDNGCGMSEEAEAKLFDPFFTTKFTGRGLGLAATLGIIRGHGGLVQVRTAPGEGTQFRILLPSAGKMGDRGKSQEPEQALLWQGAGSVLLADDEPEVLQVATRILERAGLTVYPARDGLEAVEVFLCHPGEIDCVILDLSMPRMSGDEVCQAIRNTQEDIPIILSSGYSEEDVAGKFSYAGSYHFLQKPYRRASLLAILQKILADGQRAETPGGGTPA